MEEINEDTYKDVINDALKNVQTELVIRIDSENFLVFINDIQYHDGKVVLDWSTPHEDMKEELYPHVKNAVQVMYNQTNIEIEKSFFRRFLDLFKRK